MKMENHALILIWCLIFLKDTVLGNVAEYEQIVNINDKNVKLACRINDQVQTDNVQWTRNGVQITRGINAIRDKTRLSINKGSRNEWNLQISRLQRSDETLYVCKMGNKEYSKIRLIIKTKPIIDETQSSKRDQSVKEGDTLTLTCIASGQPKPEIKWYRQSLHPYVENEARTDMGITGSTLVLPNITRYGGDLYICEASNDQDSAEREMNVTVKFNPEVTVLKTEIVTRTNVDVIMSCMVQAVPLYNAYWISPKGDKIGDNYKYEVIVEDLQGYPARFLTLVLRSAGWTEDKDAGEYRCHAEGEGVEADGMVLVTVKSDGVDDTAVKYDVPGQN